MVQTTTAPALPVYVIHGRDDFLRRRALEEVLTSILGRDRDQMAYAEFDGRTANITDVLDECRTMSLLASVRVVGVRDADDFIAVKPEEGESAAVPATEPRSRRRRPLSNREHLEKYLESPSPTGVLILVCENWKENTRLNKVAEQIGRCIVCDPPKGRPSLAAWITRHARAAYGCAMDNEAANRLADLVGDSLGVVDNELSKLATYVGARKAIHTQDVENLVGVSRAEVVFKITDAIGRGDAAGALAIWDQVLATNKDAPYMAVGGLAWAFRRLIDMKRRLVGGEPIQSVARMMGSWADPGAVKRQLDRFSLRQWQDHLVQLLHIDAATKTGLGTVQSAVEKLIIELCRTR
jgi:DNA polymerase III subunit delta